MPDFQPSKLAITGFFLALVTATAATWSGCSSPTPAVTAAPAPVAQEDPEEPAAPVPQEATQESAASEAGEPTSDETDRLYALMEDIEDGVNRLRRILKDATKYPQAVEDLQAIQLAAQQCKLIPAPMAETLPAEAQPAFHIEYHKAMVDFVVALLELERAFLDGNPDQIKEAYKKVKTMEKTGHDSFTIDE